MNHLGTKTIETDRLLLRKFNLDDANNMFINWASDDEVTKYLTWPAHKSIEESEKIIGMWIKDYDSQNFYQWCIELKQSGEAIGSISVVNIKEDICSVEVGYCIGQKYWGQGITSEAFCALIPFFFEEVQVNRIEARHDINNPKSGRVMEKCGLIKEGVQKQGLKSNSGISDSVIYGLVRDDWKKNSI